MSHRPDSNGNCFCEICESSEDEMAEFERASAEAADYERYERELAAAADVDEFGWERVETGEAPF